MALGYATRSKAVPPGHRPSRREVKSEPLNHSPAAATFAHDDSLDGAKLMLSMDYGTKTLAIAYRIMKPGLDSSNQNIHDIYFPEQGYFAPQQAAWAKDGTFFWGHGIDDALKLKLITLEEVIELWKLLLYKDHQSSQMAKAIRAQLGQREVGELISVHLQAIIKETVTLIKNAQCLEYKAEEIDQLPLQLRLSVPQMWKSPANLVMTKAAKAAGIDVELVYEPQCAAAYYTHNVKNRLPKEIEVGDVIHVADAGGGTNDVVSYEARQDCDQGAKIGLKLIAAEGALCGSEFVNQHFIAWFKKQTKNFEGECKSLGISPTACVKQASAAFETIKKAFTHIDTDPKDVVVRGVQGAKKKKLEAELTSEDIKSFFEPVIAEIIDCIDRQLTDRSKILIVPGGFGRSKYLLHKLRTRYQNRLLIMGQETAAVGAYQPVCRGALLRYKDILERGMPSRESFGIATVETYDPAIHTDATHHRGDQLPNKRICRRDNIMNSNIVERCPYDPEFYVVYERWCPILKKGEFKVPGEAFSTETWQHCFTGVQDESIRVQIYWTEGNIQKHESIRIGRDATTPLKPGIEEWGDELVMELPDLKTLGFKELNSASKGQVYEVYWRLLLTCNGANINVKWQIALPGTEPYDEFGESRVSRVELAQDEVYELCDSAHNPFARWNVG